MIKKLFFKFLFYSGILIPSFLYTIDNLIYNITIYNHYYFIYLITIYIIILNYILLYYCILIKIKWVKELAEGKI